MIICEDYFDGVSCKSFFYENCANMGILKIGAIQGLL